MIKLVLFLSLITNLSTSISKDQIPGVYHNCSGVFSGYCDLYIFYPDGSYKFYYNQMNCDKTEFWCKGNWEFNQDGTITLTTAEKEILVGGKRIKSSGDGSCGSEYEYLGGEHVIVTLENPESIVITITNLQQDPELDYLRFTMINESKFWKISEDPYEFTKNTGL